MSDASLTVVGTGIKFLSHLTVEAKVYIEQSDKVLFLVNDPAMKEWIKKSNPNTESLDFLYTKFSYREDCYHAITQYVIQTIKKNLHVCFVLYGHPGVFAQSGINAVKLAREEGFSARLLPGISAADCLFSDLLIDPGSHGCQYFEATDFLLYKRLIDPRSHLLLWQVDIICVLHNPEIYNNQKGAEMLVNYLNKFYDLQHPIVLYEAAQYPTFEPIIQKLILKDFSLANFSRISTLYIPPIANITYDQKILEELKLAGS